MIYFSWIRKSRNDQSYWVRKIVLGHKKKPRDLGELHCETRAEVPSGQDSVISPARVANHSARFDSSCPLAELVMDKLNTTYYRGIDWRFANVPIT